MSGENLEMLRLRCLPVVESLIMQVLRDSHAPTARACAEMTLYHFETGGKRLRALIPSFVFAAMGRDPGEATALGAAVEMIHNATLVHDDLQDGDEVRRDRPTIWKRYSAAQAINCGDAMFQYAFRLLARLPVDPTRLARLMDRAATSTLNVIEGQAQEFLMKEESSPGVERYLGVIRGKTSGLFAFPVVGAMEALGMDPVRCAEFERASMELGMLFQIQDDILDIYGKKGRGDKRATDIAEGKISIFVAHVNDTGTPEEKRELAAILRKPREQTTDDDLDRAIAIFDRTGAKSMAVSLIRRIQQELTLDKRLDSCPEIRGVLIELGQVFLEPVHGVL
jgi:geranylgeranyl pyrophosphate synthase